jgi:DNA-binding MarR family transcriptional regulator/ribosomal protein S18 acetylase RimI-like enzyme
MDPSAIERIRSFNRAVTQRIGALDQSYLGRGRPLGQARLIFEVGPTGAELAALRQTLALDSAYLSRLLRTLERQGLVVVTIDAADGRRRRVHLTPAGLAEWNAYDAMSDDLARSVATPLSASQRERLVEAMAEIERLLAASAITIAAEPADSADAQACLNAYFDELDQRFEGGFDRGPGGADDLPAPPGCFLVARLEDRPVGCAMLKALDANTGEIKRMWVAEGTRGLGLSRRLLGELETRAAKAGMTRIRLDTNRVLGEAQALYDKTGYRRIERYNDNPYAHVWFEKDLD